MIISSIYSHSVPLDHCEDNTCGDDQTCETLPDMFQCICNNTDEFLVNGSCTLPGSSVKVWKEIYILIWKLGTYILTDMVHFSYKTMLWERTRRILFAYKLFISFTNIYHCILETGKLYFVF